MSSFFLALGVMFYALNLPKAVPVVITVSDWGEAKYIGNVGKFSYSGITVPPAALQYQLRKFIVNMHTLPADADILRNNLKECYAMLTSSAAAKLSSFLKETNPFSSFGVKVTRVLIESILDLSESSYQVDFILTTSRPDGSESSSVRKRAVLTVKMLEPPEDERIYNPLGIYLTAFDITNIGAVK